jgi:hypothetical protein
MDEVKKKQLLQIVFFQAHYFRTFVHFSLGGPYHPRVPYIFFYKTVVCASQRRKAMKLHFEVIYDRLF